MVNNDILSNKKTPHDYLERIRELIRTGGTANLRHWGDGKIVVGENGQWHYEGFVNLSQAMHEALRAVDPSIPAGLPAHVLDPEVIARFFKIPLEDLNWQGGEVDSKITNEGRRQGKNQPLNDPPAPQGQPPPDVSMIAKSLQRIADVLDPPPSKIVDSPYVADRLGCTTVWVAEMARRGQIPKNCIVPGTGNGKVWKFYRPLIDQWIESR
jgi:hypothetical protein